MIRLTTLLLAFLAVGTAHADDAPAKKVTVYILAGQSNMEGHGQTRSLSVLEESKDGRALLRALRAKDGTWVERDDVVVHWPGHSPQTGPLAPGWGYNQTEVGPELGFGAVVGERHDHPVLIIKVAWGGKDVFCDFRSPSAGEPTGDEAALLAKEKANGNERAVGKFYRQLVHDVRSTLDRVPDLVPGATKESVELAGFAWFQGWNDYCRWHEREPDTDRPIGAGIIAAYPKNLAAMVRDLRKDLEAPKLPVVIGEMGIGGASIDARAKKNENDREAHAIVAFRRAQAEVAAMDDLEGVTYVPTTQYWDDRLDELRAIADRWSNEKRKKGIENTPDNELPTKELSEEYRARGGHWYCHYNGSAANYVRVGAALAEALSAKDDQSRR